LNEIANFGEIVLIVAASFSLALLGRTITERFAIPSAALFLLAAAIASDVSPRLEDAISFVTVERLAVLALIVILFNGGMHIGWHRAAVALVPILSLGVIGTFATAGLVALAAHYVLDFSWITSGLLGAAIAPTDPAVTFSVLSGREVRGRAGTIIEGESGANDPVGIALMIGMVELATTDDGSFRIVVEEFVIEMAGGIAVGVAGAIVLLRVMQRAVLPEASLYPLQVLAAAGVIYGVATLVHGSGFLAVFLAGLLVGDSDALRQREIKGFHASLASLAEITAFVALGLTIDITDVLSSGDWMPGLALAALLGLVIRPLVVFGLLMPVTLSWRERTFIAWSGLKGAVPILLAALAVIAAVDDAQQIYNVVFVVVLFSVAVQGSLVPFVAHRLRIPLYGRSS
jgi:potassium/hydrogen antiporter